VHDKLTGKQKMSQKLVRLMLALAILLSALILAALVGAQVPGATLSGTVKDPTGAVVAKAKIMVKSVATGQSTETETDSAGRYTVSNLPLGDYELSISAEGYSTNVKTVTVASGFVNTAGAASFRLRFTYFPRKFAPLSCSPLLSL
jgi:Carboxypeptidase regulatory-like domain